MAGGGGLAYANDSRVLIAVDGTANEQKSDDDASQWLPSTAGFAASTSPTR